MNILDLIFIRARMGQNANTGGNHRADVTNDGMINILDLIAVRQRLNSRCD
ncbi:MAG TPA: dockerin type I domain-containing protein [Planctomycetota bacterium]|nr:dockerin type I domain-containing protein [Planctomycetota bacterium]